MCVCVLRYRIITGEHGGSTVAHSKGTGTTASESQRAAGGGALRRKPEAKALEQEKREGVCAAEAEG